MISLEINHSKKFFKSPAETDQVTKLNTNTEIIYIQKLSPSYGKFTLIEIFIMPACYVCLFLAITDNFKYELIAQ